MQGIEEDTTRRSPPRSPSERGRLLVHWDGGFLDADLPSSGDLVVGRDASSDVRVPHVSVSRRHAKLRFGHPVLIEDLGSANGTRINGRPISGGTPTPIPEGAVIEMGDALIVLRTGEPVHAPAPAAQSMAAVRELVERVAKGNIPVTLVGETGVGKEVLADRLHSASPRAGARFLRINCAALPEQLLESELFGYERGAFTGATQPKAGLLESAHGGTVFLDEVGELPKATQAKLLRALECKECFRVGSLRPRTFDVRFVAATNRDLDAMVQSGDFRQDLFHRLCGVVIRVPPLRERVDEIEPLARGFVADVTEQLGRGELELTRSFLGALMRYAWPGNIRELKHTIECAVLVASGSRLDVPHLPERVTQGPAGQEARGAEDLRQELEGLEKQRILQALERCGGNQSRTARLLGLPRRTLIDRIETYGLPRPRKKRS